VIHPLPDGLITWVAGQNALSQTIVGGAVTIVLLLVMLVGRELSRLLLGARRHAGLRAYDTAALALVILLGVLVLERVRLVLLG
jgi:hypothetical protein